MATVRSRLRIAVPAALFVVVLVTHFGGIVTSYDSRWAIPIARSILYQGNTDLDEYLPLLEANGFYAIERVGGHYYSLFPVGVSLLAAPVVYVVDVTGIKLDNGKIEKLVASLAVAATTVLLYLIARRALTVPYALLIALVFAFCTPAWSTASRALWQHGPSMLMLTLALWLITRAATAPTLVQFAGLPLAFSYVIRPTNAVSIVVLSLFVAFRYRAFFARYLLWALPVAVAFALFNLSTYGALQAPYYSAGRIGHASVLGEALIGHLVSPARGLFVFSPVLVLSVYGAWLALRVRREALDRCLIIIVILHWLVISSFPQWHGGHSFGNRLFSDMLPYLIYFLIPVASRVADRPGRRRRIILALGGALAAISFFVNYRGANTRAVYTWNSDPVDVDFAPARIWDWQDLQFLRGLVVSSSPEHPRRQPRP